MTHRVVGQYDRKASWYKDWCNLAFFFQHKFDCLCSSCLVHVQYQERLFLDIWLPAISGPISHCNFIAPGILLEVYKNSLIVQQPFLQADPLSSAFKDQEWFNLAVQKGPADSGVK